MCTTMIIQRMYLWLPITFLEYLSVIEHYPTNCHVQLLKNKFWFQIGVFCGILDLHLRLNILIHENPENILYFEIIQKKTNDKMACKVMYKQASIKFQWCFFSIRVDVDVKQIWIVTRLNGNCIQLFRKLDKYEQNILKQSNQPSNHSYLFWHLFMCKLTGLFMIQFNQSMFPFNHFFITEETFNMGYYPFSNIFEPFCGYFPSLFHQSQFKNQEDTIRSQVNQIKKQDSPNVLISQQINHGHSQEYLPTFKPKNIKSSYKIKKTSIRSTYKQRSKGVEQKPNRNISSNILRNFFRKISDNFKINKILDSIIKRRNLKLNSNYFKNYVHQLKIDHTKYIRINTVKKLFNNNENPQVSLVLRILLSHFSKSEGIAQILISHKIGEKSLLHHLEGIRQIEAKLWNAN